MVLVLEHCNLMLVLEQEHYNLVQAGYSLVLVLEQGHYNLVQEGYNLVLEQGLGDCSLLLGQAHCNLM